MSGSIGSGAGNSPNTAATGALQAGSGSVDKVIQQMNDAFALATETNVKITVAKTIDGALETAAQQRPNIG